MFAFYKCRIGNPCDGLKLLAKVQRTKLEDKIMLYWALLFFIIALIAGVFGFGGIAAGASSIAQILFVVFLVLFVISLIMGRRTRSY